MMKKIGDFILTVLGASAMVLIINVIVEWIKLLIPPVWAEFFQLLMGILIFGIVIILRKFMGDKREEKRTI